MSICSISPLQTGHSGWSSFHKLYCFWEGLKSMLRFLGAMSFLLAINDFDCGVFFFRKDSIQFITGDP